MAKEKKGLFSKSDAGDKPAKPEKKSAQKKAEKPKQSVHYFLVAHRAARDRGFVATEPVPMTVNRKMDMVGGCVRDIDRGIVKYVDGGTITDEGNLMALRRYDGLLEVTPGVLAKLDEIRQEVEGQQAVVYGKEVTKEEEKPGRDPGLFIEYLDDNVEILQSPVAEIQGDDFIIIKDGKRVPIPRKDVLKQRRANQ